VSKVFDGWRPGDGEGVRERERGREVPESFSLEELVLVRRVLPSFVRRDVIIDLGPGFLNITQREYM